MRGAASALALVAAVLIAAPPASDSQQRGFSNNPCDHEPPEGVTCRMGLEEMCKGTFSLFAMYTHQLGYQPDTNVTCCTASVFASECSPVWCVVIAARAVPQSHASLTRVATDLVSRALETCSRQMMQLLRTCPTFRRMTIDIPEGTDTDPSIAHDLCDACLYESPGDPNSLDKPAAAGLRARLEVFPNDHSGKKRAISF